MCVLTTHLNLDLEIPSTLLARWHRSHVKMALLDGIFGSTGGGEDSKSGGATSEPVAAATGAAGGGEHKLKENHHIRGVTVRLRFWRCGVIGLPRSLLLYPLLLLLYCYVRYSLVLQTHGREREFSEKDEEACVFRFLRITILHLSKRAMLSFVSHKVMCGLL